MSTTTADYRRPSPWRQPKRIIGLLVVAIIIVAMGVDTTVVPMGSVNANENKFSPQGYGQAKFPEIQQNIVQHAVPAAKLATALADDQAGAIDKYAVGKGTFPVIPVKFTGVIGKGQLGTYHIKVDGLPQSVSVRVQTGPAIMGVVLRDSDSSIQFGDFVNQIQYQNAAAGINSAMKQQVLADLDRKHLKGKTIQVVGAFQLINPNNWLITPVKVSVQQ